MVHLTPYVGRYFLAVVENFHVFCEQQDNGTFLVLLVDPDFSKIVAAYSGLETRVLPRASTSAPLECFVFRPQEPYSNRN